MNAFLVESPGPEETSTPDAFKAAVVRRLLATKGPREHLGVEPSFLTMLLDWAIEERETLSRENLLWGQSLRVGQHFAKTLLDGPQSGRNLNLFRHGLMRMHDHLQMVCEKNLAESMSRGRGYWRRKDL